MASETPAKSSSWGLWSFVETVTSTVKQKSDEIINIYKEDLQEFSRTIVSDTSAVIKDKVDMLANDSKATRASSSSSPTHLQARFLRLQRDPKTYTSEAADQADYEAWTASFNIGSPETTEAITLLLTSSEPVREFHTALVPSKVAYRDFWCRYYYKIHKIEEEEQRRAVILKNVNANEDEDFSWDVEDDNNNTNNNKSTPSPKDSSNTKIGIAIDTITNNATEPQHIVEDALIQATETPSDITTQSTEQVQTKLEQESTEPTEPKQEQEQQEQQEPQEPEPSSPTPQTHDEADDIDEEIARKFESQKLEPQKLEQKSDAEDGWADWE